MFPLKDKNETDSVPVFTVVIIVVNCLVFGYEIYLTGESYTTFNQFVRTWGFVPNKLHVSSNGQTFLSLFSSMFLHGGYVHLFSNMLFLWVFGDNVEDAFGHFNFLLFYLSAGLAGSFAQYFFTPDSSAPLIGASGAIAGVLGSYLLFYPTAEVLTAIIFVVVIRLVYLPAWILLGFWFVLQLLQGTASLGMQPTGGGVAWFAHLGGFVTGFLISVFVRAGKTKRGLS